MTRQEIEQKVGKTWTTDELREEFEVIGFSMGFCVAKNNKTNERGSLSFDRFQVEGMGDVRLYHSFVLG
jgi:hypothetical protein